MTRCVRSSSSRARAVPAGVVVSAPRRTSARGASMHESLLDEPIDRRHGPPPDATDRSPAQAATSGIAAEEQGLAGSLVITSLQLGSALVLAVVTAVNAAATGPASYQQSLLDGYHVAIAVSLSAAALSTSPFPEPT